MIEIRKLTQKILTVICVLAFVFSILLMGNTGIEAKELAVEPIVLSTLYVSPTGVNSGIGTAAAPYKTIQYAIGKAVPGTTIYVKAGTYNQKLSIVNKSNVSIVNYPGQRPKITGVGFTSGDLISIATSSGIKFSGFEITNYWSSTDYETIYIKAGCSNIEISNNIIHDLGTTSATGNVHGIYVKSYTSQIITNVTIKNNQLYNLKTGRSESITIQGNVSGFLIYNNKIHNNNNIGIDIAGFYGSTTISASLNQARNGKISYNMLYDIYCPYATCAAIYIDGGRDITIENNVTRNTMVGIEVGCENATDETTGVAAVVSGIIIRKNTIYNCSSRGISIGGYDGLNTGKVINTQILYNTLYKNGHYEISMSYCDNTTVSRNIIYALSSSDYFIRDEINMATNLHSNNNVFYVASGTGKWQYNGIYAYSLAQWKTKTGQDINSKFINPQFINPAARNFNLTVGSPATGYGAK